MASSSFRLSLLKIRANKTLQFVFKLINSSRKPQFLLRSFATVFAASLAIVLSARLDSIAEFVSFINLAFIRFVSIEDPRNSRMLISPRKRRVESERRNSAAAQHNLKLYVMGGVRNHSMYFCPHVDVYCPDDRSWYQLINGIDDTVTTHAVLGKKLFCVLWCEIELSFFDPTDNSWTILEVPFAEIPVRCIQLGILYNKLLLFSIHDDPDYYQTVVYDPAAPQGLQWCRSKMRAPGPCLSTVTIEA